MQFHYEKIMGKDAIVLALTFLLTSVKDAKLDTMQIYTQGINSTLTVGSTREGHLFGAHPRHPRNEVHPQCLGPIMPLLLEQWK